ncbi:MAG: hypothetical protein J07HB67_01707 [halophilic archaeon J07HB67]|nr:MAG: hypothetical protein J07HB67_01707 [halophilic archaeon J07HB67]
MSVVFQRALRDRFERHLSAVNGHQWYPTADVVAAFQTVAEEAGPATMRKGGMECAKAVTDDEEVAGVGSALGSLRAAHAEAHRGPTAGDYTYDHPRERSVRVGITGDYPYGAAFAEGVFVQLVRECGPENAIPFAERATPRDEEAAAWRLRW